MVRIFYLMLILGLVACGSTANSTINSSSPSTNPVVITPLQFGAIGDGKADDTKAFKAAIEYCIENNRKLYIPSGTFKITSTLKLRKALRIEGESVSSSYLWFDPKTPQSLFVLAANKDGFNMQVSDLKMGLRNFGKGLKNVHAFEINNSLIRGMNFRNLEFFGFTGYGIYFKGANTYGQNLAFRDLAFYRMGGMVGQSNDRGISNWWTNLVVFENINLDAYSGHSINLESPQKYIFDIRGWRTVSITNLLIEGSLKAKANIQASVRVGGGYQPSGSYYLGLGNVIINGYWEEWSSKDKPKYSIESMEGISSLDINDYNGMDILVTANAQTVSIRGVRIHGLNIKDRIHLKGKAKLILENVHNSSKKLVDKSLRNNPNVDIRSVNEKN